MSRRPSACRRPSVSTRFAPRSRRCPFPGHRSGRGLVLAILLACSFSLAATLPALADHVVSGTVTSEETGAPLEGITVGITRQDSCASLAPDRKIPVEATGVTDANGVYRISIDETAPGVDRLYVFTTHETVFNEVWPATDTHAMVPWKADVDDPNVQTVDVTGGDVTNVDFQVASSKRTEYVLMRDGVTHLGTDIWLPSRIPGMSWDTLLQRTPYGRGTPSRMFIEADYAVVINSTRGREDSEGEDGVFDDDGWLEHQDGYDTVEWIAEQPWSTGKICTFGGSAPGITQYLVAGAAPPHLVCCVAEIATANFYHHMNYPGGEFRKHMVETWLDGQGSTHKLDEIWAHPNEDEYWDERNLMNRLDHVVVPILHIGGWYDIFSQGTLDFFHHLQNEGGVGARFNQKLVIGPWIHGWYASPWQGELQYPWNSIFSDYSELVMRWYAFWLRGEDNGVMDEPPARYYVMGPGMPEAAAAPGNVWRLAPDWPPPATERAYYLHPGGLLSTAPPPAGGAFAEIVSDPADPVPTRGGSNLYDDIGQGPMDQRPVDERADVLTWETPTLTAPLEISGPVRLELWASSDRTDTDWVVKLEDVYPDGRAMLVTDLVLMGRHRVSFRQEDLLTPGEVYHFTVNLWDTSITLPAGHKLRVAVASSNWPRFRMNPQTGEPFHEETHQEVATNRVYQDVDHPTRLVVSVVDPVAVTGCRPEAYVTGLTVEKLEGGERIRLSWDPVEDDCHRRYRVYAGDRAPWPWIVRNRVGATEATAFETDRDAIFWQVVSEGTDGGNGPHGSP